MLPLESEVQKFYGRRRSDLILGREAHEELYSPPVQCEQTVDARAFDKHFAKACGTINDTKLVGSTVTVSDLKLGNSAEWVSILTSQPADRSRALKSAEQQAPEQFELVIKRSPQSTTGDLQQIELMPIGTKSPPLNPAQTVESGAAILRTAVASVPTTLEVTPLLTITNSTNRANDVEELPSAVRSSVRISVVADSISERTILAKGSTTAGAAAKSADSPATTHAADVALVRTSVLSQDAGPSQIGKPVTFIQAELLPGNVRAAVIKQSAELVAQPARVQSAAGDMAAGATRLQSPGGDLVAPSPRIAQSPGGDLVAQPPRIMQSPGGDLVAPSPRIAQSPGGDLVPQPPRIVQSSGGDLVAQPPRVVQSAAGDLAAAVPRMVQGAGGELVAPSPRIVQSKDVEPVADMPNAKPASPKQATEQPPLPKVSPGSEGANALRFAAAGFISAAVQAPSMESKPTLSPGERDQTNPSLARQSDPLPARQADLIKVGPILASNIAGAAAIGTGTDRQVDHTAKDTAITTNGKPSLNAQVVGVPALAPGSSHNSDVASMPTANLVTARPELARIAEVVSSTFGPSQVVPGAQTSITQAERTIQSAPQTKADVPFNIAALADAAGLLRAADALRGTNSPTGQPAETPRAVNLPGGQPADAPRAVNLPGLLPAETPRAVNLPGLLPADTPRAANLPGGQPADTPRAVNLPGLLPADTPRAANPQGSQPAETPRAVNLPGLLPADTPRAANPQGGQPAETPRFSSATGGQMVDALATHSLASHLADTRLNSPSAQLAEGGSKPQTAVDGRLETLERKPARETEFARLPNIANGPMDISVKATQSTAPSDAVVTPIKQALQTADSAMPTAAVPREIQSGKDNLTVKDGLSANGTPKESVAATGGTTKEFGATSKESTNAASKEFTATTKESGGTTKESSLGSKELIANSTTKDGSVNATTKESSLGSKELIASSTTRDGSVNATTKEFGATIKEPSVGATGSKEPAPTGSNATIKDAAIVSFNQEDGRRQTIQQDASTDPKPSTKNSGVLPTGNDTSTNTASTKAGNDSGLGTSNQIGGAGGPGISKDFDGSYDNKNQIREGQTPGDINQVKTGKQPITSGDSAGIDPSASIRAASDNRIIGTKPDSIGTDGRGALPQEDRNPLHNDPRVPKTDEKDLGTNGKLDESHNSKNMPVVIVPERTSEPPVKPTDRAIKQNPVDTKVTQQRGHQRRLPYLVKAGDTIELIAEKLFKERRFATLILTINRANIRFIDNGGKMLPLLTAGQILWMPSQQERETYATKVLGHRIKVPQVNIFDEIADMIERRSKTVKLQPIRMPEVTIMYPAPSNSSAQSFSTTSGEQQAYKFPTLSQVVRKIQLTSRRPITLNELDSVQGPAQLIDRLTSASIVNPGSPAGGCDRSPKSPQTQQPIEPLSQKQEAKLIIDRLAAACRVVTSNQSADQSDFNSVLQLALGGEWKTIASYEVRRGQAYRYSFKNNGNIQPFAMDLPLMVVTQMAREDFTRNWAAYCSEFHQQQADR